jgi:hypothetical protein
VAVVGTALALFAVARRGAWPRLLYLLSVGYLAYFAAGGAWQDLWEVASVPAEGPAQTLALTLELAMRLVVQDFASERYWLVFAHAYDLAVMPILQLVALVYLARALVKS